MQVFIGLDSIEKDFQNTVVTLGVFDGVHLAHQKIMNKTADLAEEKNQTSVCISFEPHPKNIFEDNDNVFLPILTTVEEKIEIVEDCKLDTMVFIDLTKNFMNLSPEEFVKQVLLDKFGVNDVVVGYNYTFGHNEAGTTDTLENLGQKYDFNTQIVTPVRESDEVISSTLIRKLLQKGKVERASQLLGRPYCLRGKIGHGDKIGRDLGFPTANVFIRKKEKLIPGNGVYFTRIYIGGEKYFGVCNIGVRPTLEKGEKQIEVHILNLDDINLYEKEVELEFLERLRDEKKFENVEKLKKQIDQDTKLGIEKIKQYKNGG